jgi:hypothetical protein
MLIGIFLILLGSLMLLDRMGIIDIHMGDYIIPIVFIAIGASMVVKAQNRPAQGPTVPPTA